MKYIIGDDLDWTIDFKTRNFGQTKELSSWERVQVENYKNLVNRLYGKPNEIKKVIFNDPATIVFWDDGSKTVVKAHDEPFDPEKGLAMAISKKFLGNKGNYYNEFKKWLPEEEEDNDLFLSMDEVLENLKDSIENLNCLSKSL